MQSAMDFFQQALQRALEEQAEQRQQLKQEREELQREREELQREREELRRHQLGACSSKYIYIHGFDGMYIYIYMHTLCW